LNDDIEAKYLEYLYFDGPSQQVFEQQQIVIDFNNMVEIKAQSRKQKKIKRRPKFACKEPSEQMDGPLEFRSWLNSIEKPWYWVPQHNNHFDFSTYQLLDVDHQSPVMENVHRHFNRTMNDIGYKIVRVKSIQNLHLWAKFMRLRSQLDSSDIKVSDKFVFRSTTIDKWLGVCQQGFKICNCGNDHSQNVFVTEADQALADDKRTNPTSNGLRENEIHRYMFCVRMSAPQADLKENDSNLPNTFYNDHNIMSPKARQGIHNERTTITSQTQTHTTHNKHKERKTNQITQRQESINTRSENKTHSKQHNRSANAQNTQHSNK
jgi:hypothetical protein